MFVLFFKFFFEVLGCYEIYLKIIGLMFLKIFFNVEYFIIEYFFNFLKRSYIGFYKEEVNFY